jgi:hypothetical protein
MNFIVNTLKCTALFGIAMIATMSVIGILSLTISVSGWFGFLFILVPFIFSAVVQLINKLIETWW